MVTYLSPGSYVEELPSGSRPMEPAGTAVAAFVGATAEGPFNRPTLVTNWGQYISTFGGFMEDSYTPISVYNFFLQGGGSTFVVRVGENGGPTSGRPYAELTSAVNADKMVARIEARADSTDGDPITVEIRESVPPPAPEGEGEPAGGERPSEETFDVVVSQGSLVEEYPAVTVRRNVSTNWAAAMQRSALVAVREVANISPAERRPSNGRTQLVPAGRLPVHLTVGDLAGTPGEGTGISALEANDQVTMVLVPDLVAAHQAGTIDLTGVEAVQKAMIAHCELMQDRMAILDTPFGLTPSEAREWVVEKARYNSAYAALYYPPLLVFDPGVGGPRTIPASGAMAGIWSRTDNTRGVFKAPANAQVRGALDVERLVTRGEQDQLNPVGINVIRPFTGSGILVWGARTLSSDSSWRYINVRRLFNMIETSILNGTQWAVFEPNDMDLWQQIKRTINPFLRNLWNDGALFGATQEQAFYVKCDEETNPPEVIDAGRVVIEIGIAPVKPAEFVVFRISQLSSGGTSAE